MVNSKPAGHKIALALIVVLALSVFISERGIAQQSTDTTFRLLTFELASSGSGPRLGTTRGNGDQDILDVHNAITYLYRASATEIQMLPAIPIDMKALIEAGDTPIRAARSLHDTMTTLRESGSFEEPGGDRRVFYPPGSVRYLPPIVAPSKVISL